MKITIHFDGGCAPTNPGNKYGSYEINYGGTVRIRIERITFGWGTNNEAEFHALSYALDALHTFLSIRNKSPHDISLELFTDSKIVVNRISGLYKKNKTEPQQRMFALTQGCLAQMKPFQSFSIHWNSRSVNVTKFGH